MLRIFRRNRKPTPDLPRDFGYKCQWLALKAKETQPVVTALQLRRVTPANWAMGIEGAYSNKIFVSPVLGQWVLAIGTTLPNAGDVCHPDKMTPMLIELSKIFEEVQYFVTHRVVEYHAWVKAKQGEIIRAYAFLGETTTTLWNKGDRTPEEIELGFSFVDETSPEAKDESFWEREDLRFPNEEDVMAIAGKWSVDPLFESNQYDPGVGVLGALKKFG